jgi:DNA-binding response OmpR family regulator
MNRKPVVLLVEDDSNLCESLMSYLSREGFEVRVAGTLAETQAKLEEALPDVVVLDWMLPDGQGIDLLKDLSRTRPTLPVVLLTARAELVDKVVGLESGASDYLTKPFEPRELVARLRVQLRKVGALAALALQGGGAPNAEELLEFAGVRMDLRSREVRYEGRLVELAKLEFELLKLFMENPNRVFPREALLNQVWGYENFPTTRTVDNHVVLLRQKLDANLIETVRGVGYRLRKIVPSSDREFAGR